MSANSTELEPFRAVLEQPCLTGGRTGTVRPVVGQALFDRWSDRHCSTGGQTGTVRPVVGQALFDRWSDRNCPTEAPAGGSDRPVQSVPGTGRTGPAGTSRTNLSDQLALADSARPTTGRTRLFEHRSNCRV
ncbi:hypothetical protein PCASD_09701 [Puccinia coronata f. sp. avenae]|uniref:Uncharacterized protein n=1 Tax=Puccinia coronata f. sp. avenae TaxID=200324 RepID=A0A2N5TF91_9BASI|nr:hypothetical protein PCASD_09701 [Puccinia coronata f. sp. avenae]